MIEVSLKCSSVEFNIWFIISCFFCNNSWILISIVSLKIGYITLRSSVEPILFARSSLWEWSTGFHHKSENTTLLEAVSVIDIPAAFKLPKNILIFLFFWNFSTASSRSLVLVAPVYITLFLEYFLYIFSNVLL